MRIGLVSDSHGNLAALERALDLLHRAQVDRVYFLGGRVADVERVLARRAGGDLLAARVVRVASRGCPEHERGEVPRKQVDLVEGRLCALVHDKGELTRDDIANAAVIFHGNSAAPALVQIGPRCFVTPGHLRDPAPEGRPATFALAEVTEREIVLRVLAAADGALLREERALTAPGGRLLVR